MVQQVSKRSIYPTAIVDDLDGDVVSCVGIALPDCVGVSRVTLYIQNVHGSTALKA
jgi:hypothetical protein